MRDGVDEVEAIVNELPKLEDIEASDAVAIQKAIDAYNSLPADKKNDPKIVEAIAKLQEIIKKLEEKGGEITTPIAGKPEVKTVTIETATVTVNGTTITVTVPYANQAKSIGKVSATLNEKVTMLEVLVGSEDKTSVFTDKFGKENTTFANDKINSVWTDIAKNNDVAKITVENANKVKEIFTITVVFEAKPEAKVYTLEEIQTNAVKGAGVAGNYMIDINRANIVAKYPEATNDTVFLITIDGVEYEIGYYSAKDTWRSKVAIQGQPMDLTETTAKLNALKVTIK